MIGSCINITAVSVGIGDKKVGRTTKRTKRCPSGEERFHVGVVMKEDLVEDLRMTEVHVVVMMTVLYAEGWMRTEAHAEPLTMTVLQEGVEMMTVAQGVALTMIVVPDGALMKTEVRVEGWMTRGVPGVGLMMTGVPGEEEEMMTEVDGEAWMMGHVVVGMTAQLGSP